jgi:hypothetical protein
VKILKHSALYFYFQGRVKKDEKPIAMKVAARAKKDSTAMVPPKAPIKRKHTTIVSSKAPNQQVTTREAGQITLPEEMAAFLLSKDKIEAMASFLKQYNFNVASTVDCLKQSKTMVANFMKC